MFNKAREYELTPLSWIIIWFAAIILGLLSLALIASNTSIEDSLPIVGDDIPPKAHPARDLSKSIATVSTDYDMDVVGEVITECERIGLPPTLCLGVVFQEGGLVRDLWPNAIGDGGESCGPLQINKIHWTNTKQCEYWFDIGRSFDLMGSRWKWAFNKNGGAASWTANPVDFLKRFAPDAQGSIGWSTGLAQTNLSLADGAYASYLRNAEETTGADPCEVSDALKQLGNQQLQVAAQIDETTFLANLARIQSGGHPIGTAYTQLANRLATHHSQVTGLAQAILYEAEILCPSPPAVAGRFPVDASLTQSYGITPFVQANPGLYVVPPGHSGLDFGAPYGDTVRALRSGVVTYAGWRNYYGQAVNDGTGFGMTVAVSEGGNVWWYAHLSRIDVIVGQEVNAGQTVGLVGSTGRSTGPHLHFELRQNGVVSDPTPFLGWKPSILAAAEGEELPHD